MHDLAVILDAKGWKTRKRYLNCSENSVVIKIFGVYKNLLRSVNQALKKISLKFGSYF